MLALADAASQALHSSSRKVEVTSDWPPLNQLAEVLTFLLAHRQPEPPQRDSEPVPESPGLRARLAPRTMCVSVIVSERFVVQAIEGNLSAFGLRQAPVDVHILDLFPSESVLLPRVLALLTQFGRDGQMGARSASTDAPGEHAVDPCRANVARPGRVTQRRGRGGIRRMRADPSSLSLAWYRAGRCRARALLTGDIVTVGRSAENHLVVDVAGVSRQHARLERIPAGWVLRDLGSRNGTTLNGIPCSTPVIVAVGDRMRVGVQELRFDGTASLRRPRTLRRVGMCACLLVMVATMHLAPGAPGADARAAGTHEPPASAGRTTSHDSESVSAAVRGRTERHRRVERTRRQALHALEVNDPLAAIGHFRELYLLLEPDNPEREATASRLTRLGRAWPLDTRKTERP